MTAAEALDRGRKAFRRQAWSDAFGQLSAADREAPLEPEDLERLATAANLIGRGAECVDLLTRAHQEFLGRGDVQRSRALRVLAGHDPDQCGRDRPR